MTRSSLLIILTLLMTVSCRAPAPEMDMQALHVRIAEEGEKTLHIVLQAEIDRLTAAGCADPTRKSTGPCDSQQTWAKACEVTGIIADEWRLANDAVKSASWKEMGKGFCEKR